MSINVTVKNLTERIADAGVIKLSLNEGSTVSDAVKLAGIPEERAGVMLINMTLVKMNRALSDGDELTVYPPIIGG